MNCKKTRLSFYDFSDDTLDRKTRAVIESHLSGCAACRRHYETQRRMHQSITGAVAGELAGLHFQPQPITTEPSGANLRLSLGVLIGRTAFAIPALLLFCVILWPLLKHGPERIDGPGPSAYDETYRYLEMYSADKPGASSFAMPVAVIIQPGIPARVIEIDGTTDLSTELK